LLFPGLRTFYSHTRGTLTAHYTIVNVVEEMHTCSSHFILPCDEAGTKLSMASHD